MAAIAAVGRSAILLEETAEQAEAAEVHLEAGVALRDEVELGEGVASKVEVVEAVEVVEVAVVVEEEEEPLHRAGLRVMTRRFSLTKQMGPK